MPILIQPIIMDLHQLSKVDAAHDDDLARDMACFLWECSRLRHGLFTPPEFIPLVSARLREYLTSHKPNDQGQTSAPNTNQLKTPDETQ